MELQLTEDQALFVETTRRFLQAESPLTRVRELASEPDGFDRSMWRRGAELGWTSMLVSERDGGGSIGEHGLLDLVLVAEEMGRLVAPGPLVPVNVVAAALSAGAGPELKEKVLPGLLSGETVATWGGPTMLSAAADEDGWAVSGVLPAVEAGGQSDHVLVDVMTPDRRLHLLVDLSTPGVTVTPLDGLDLVRRFAEVRLDGAVVPAGHEVAVSGDWLLDIAAVLQCAEMTGTMERVFEMTVEYLGDRYSFGRPLSSYQALKHRIADDKLAVESSHAVATAAARAVATGAANASEIVSAAKAWIGPHSTELIQDCVQLHGGIGVTWEHDLHLYLRRCTVDRVTYGTADDHHERIAARLLGERL